MWIAALVLLSLVGSVDRRIACSAALAVFRVGGASLAIEAAAGFNETVSLEPALHFEALTTIA